MNAMQRAKAAMDIAAMRIVVTAHKDKARALLNEKPVVMTNRAYRIVDRWWRRKAYYDPMGKFYHGSTYEEPRRNQPRIIPLFGPGDGSAPRWNGVPEIKS